jgi:hypothetical protein
METEVVVDVQHLVFEDAHCFAVVVVQGVAEWNDGVEHVVPTGELQNHKGGRLLISDF